MRLFTALPIALAMFSLAACSSRDDAEQTAPTPTPTPVLTMQPQPTEAADGTKLTPGRWDVGADAASAHGTYAEPGLPPSAIFACERASKDLTLTLAGNASKEETYRLEAGELKAGVIMAPAGDGMVTATVDQTQPIFAALTDPETMLVVSGPSMETLRLPGHRALARVIKACF